MVEPFASRDSQLKVALTIADWLAVPGVLEFFQGQINAWEDKVKQYDSRGRLGAAPLHNPPNQRLSLPDHCVLLAWLYKDYSDEVRKLRDYAPDIVPSEWAKGAGTKAIPQFYIDGPKKCDLFYYRDEIPERGLRVSLEFVCAALFLHGIEVPEWDSGAIVGVDEREPGGKVYYPKEIAASLKCSTKQLQTYAIKANIKNRPEKKGDRYSRGDLITLLDHVINGGAMTSDIIDGARGLKAEVIANSGS